MATLQITSASEVATQRDIDESQELQDKGIRREFRNVHQKLDELRQQVDDRFQQVDDRFQQVDDRFQQVDDRFQQVDDRFQDLEVLIKNSRATSGWHDIFPVRVQNPLAEPRNRYQTPPYFPSKVVKFWRLQRPRHLHQLVELLRFYSIRASDLTTAIFEDNGDTESESSSESQSTLEGVTLEEAVKANPAFALARLAAPLGLDYSSISHSMGLYEQIQSVRAQQAAQRTKREQSKEKDVERPTKKTATSQDILPQRSGTGIPIEELAACRETFSYKSPTPLSHVAWAPRPTDAVNSPTSRASASSSKKTATTPSQPSKGSTIPFTHTSSVIKGAGKTTSRATGEPENARSMHTSSKHSQTSEETSF
jgi:hypothetical protein